MSEPGLLEVASRVANLLVIQIGCWVDHMPIILQEIASDRPAYVLELHGLCAFFCRKVIGDMPVIVSCRDEVGSFGCLFTPLDH